MLKIDEQSHLKRQLDATNKWGSPVAGSPASRRSPGFFDRPADLDSLDQNMLERAMVEVLIKNKQIVLNIVGENYRSAGNLEGRW